MKEKEFKEKYLERIRAVLDFSIRNPYSDFYRKLYGSKSSFLDIKSLEDFERIPLLNKDDILAKPLTKRIFVPKDRVAKYMFTSGTINKLSVLVTPHLEQTATEERKKQRKDLAERGIINHLFLVNPLHGAIHPANHASLEGMVVINGDIYNLARTAVIANSIPIDAIQSTPTIIKLFIEELKKTSFNPRQIKYVSLGGEWTSKNTRKFVKDFFTNALVDVRYGASEIAHLRGYQCKYLAGELSDSFHIIDDYLIEIIDGEIVHTDLNPNKAFPLIRYRTGDMGVVEYEKCKCGKNQILRLVGRSGTDVLHFSGLSFYSNLIDQALLASECKIRDFQLRITEKVTNGKILPFLSFTIETDEKNKEGKILESILENLQISSSGNLRDLIKREIILPIKVKTAPKIGSGTGKQKKIILEID
jgi:phenylacetate-CoA ligase